MKRTYISPMAKTIKLNLSSSVLEEGAGVGTGSNGAYGGDMQANATIREIGKFLAN